MKTKMMRLSDIKQGTIRQQILTQGFIARVQKYKEILREVETTSLEETVSNFQRDLKPERELIIWEIIADIYRSETMDKPELAMSEKDKIFKDVLVVSLG